MLARLLFRVRHCLSWIAQYMRLMVLLCGTHASNLYDNIAHFRQTAPRLPEKRHPNQKKKHYIVWYDFFLLGGFYFGLLAPESVVALFLFLYCLFVCYLNNISLFIAYSLWSSHALILFSLYRTVWPQQYFWLCISNLWTNAQPSAPRVGTRARLQFVFRLFFPIFFIHPFLREQILF